MKKFREYLEVSLWAIGIGVGLNVIGFLVLSFTLWEFPNIDWEIVRGIIAGLWGLAILVGFAVDVGGSSSETEEVVEKVASEVKEA